MGKRTVKVGITGKFGTRYGANLRKRVKKIEISQHSKHFCAACGKFAIKRKAVGIWHCNGPCKITFAGGAWSLHTVNSSTVKSTIRRLRELQDK
ncbi:60S ribosomal protein L37a [Diplonema papillatum]|nr:60S ribosomal protein L37a [Diplonema papillatum]KAJ9458069.1 60S ribosomal protein L37a [Diplonema papillatum]